MFRQDFKYYKSRNPLPDLLEVLDFNCIEQFRHKVEDITCLKLDTTIKLGLKPPEEWAAYRIPSNPGLIFIRNPFTSAGQCYWIVRCLRDFTKKPNKLNLDAHNLIPGDSDWWSISQSDQELMNKLRWATLGYHHNWDTKVYNDNEKGEFPQDLKSFSSYIGAALGFEDYNAEAAIVNYYHMNSTLSGHTDHSEHFLEAPLFSVSFGQSAIFLIGGQTLEEKPTAIFLHSGDVVVMSKESRLCYHGVPKITKAPQQTWNDGPLEPNFQPFNNYIKNSRININIRQVTQPV